MVVDMQYLKSQTLHQTIITKTQQGLMEEMKLHFTSSMMVMVMTVMIRSERHNNDSSKIYNGVCFDNEEKRMIDVE